jgi:hypothetical protein
MQLRPGVTDRADGKPGEKPANGKPGENRKRADEKGMKDVKRTDRPKK